MLEKQIWEMGCVGWDVCLALTHTPKSSKLESFSKPHILVWFFPARVGLSPRELGWIFKSVPVGTVILEIYPSVLLGQGLSSFLLQLEKQDAVTACKY